jgi:hypothetical protein
MSQPPATPTSAAPITFIVQGQAAPGGVQAGGGTRSAGGSSSPRTLPGTVKAAVRLGALRGAAQPHTLVAVPGEDVVALHIAGGPVLLLHPENARDLLLAQAGTATTTRGSRGLTAAQAAGAGVPVSATLRWQGLENSTTTRGLLGDVVLAAFEVLTGLVKDEVADFAASQVVAKVDSQVQAGVYALSPESLPPLKGSGRRVAALPASTEPVLVLIHGTFVETTSTFGKLWAQHPQRVRQLFQHYGGRVYALEHETLGKSPIDNALELVKALPRGTRLHLLTHSRGGLVAEVLARMAHQRSVGAADDAFFAGPSYAAQRATLRLLADEMTARDVKVERVVRVACPARGTLLASKRLDAYLSVFKWALEATGLPLLPAVMDFLGEVARRRADPALLPGMAAMIAGTPLLEWLNAAPAPIAGELRVVAGDLEGDSLSSWLKTLVTDAYYWTDHDIVVQTSSMYAGAARKDGASFLLDQGGKTTHFAYFVNARTVEAVVDALVQKPLPSGFAPIGPLSWAGRSADGLRGTTEAAAPQPSKPAVFMLPGILGSNLAVDGRRIWLGLGLVGGLGQLEYGPDNTGRVQPDGAISLVYDKLMRHLQATHEVIEFAFDWRVPIEQEAQRLATAVTAALDARAASGTVVQILAHSMGGVLARCMALEAPAVWQRLMAHPQARLLMLGTPNGGSWAPMQVLSGDDTFGNALAAFGSPLADRAARRIMAGMPGFLQLQAGLLDPALGLDQEATWARLADDDYTRMQQANWWHRHAGEEMQAAYHWGVPPQAVLDAAKALRLRLDAQREQDLPQWAHKLALVVGRAPATPVGFEVGTQGFVYLDANDGDGRVPLTSALLPGVATWQLGCDHGSLPSETSAFAAYVELLNTGKTAALPPLLDSTTRGQRPAPVASRPSRRRRSARPAALQDAVFRSAADEAAPGGPTEHEEDTLQLRVLNGNLGFIGEPLLIGHYTASELTGTEGVVDRMLGGALQRALDAGLYPSVVGTHQVFVNTRRDPGNPWGEPRPLGVLVVGLGEEGELRESGLTESVRQGVLAWAQRQAERVGSGHATTARASLAATLLGSGGLGISPAAAARAIARGVAEANQRASASGWPVVQRLTLVELYLDRATDAWNGLRLLAEGHAGGHRFELLPSIESGTGPLRRQLDNGYRGADHDLIRATTRDDGSLEYVLDTRRARTEVRSQRPQTPLLRELLNAATTDRNDDPTIGRTLFQLLVPTEIEPFLNGVDRMVLELDNGTAALPWELLDTGSASHEPPWALRTRLLRRLQKAAPMAKLRDASADHDVLIVGEPLVSAEWAPLPAAREEALAVEEALCGAGGLPPERVLALVDSPTAQTVIGALLSRPWRIVHISGHGEAPSAANAGGVVLSGGHHLGPAEIEAMRVVPELVFVNCCNLAQYDQQQALRPGFDPGAFAAVVADQLIAKGVRCVIACGWPVNDGPAAEFARVFYTQLLRGARFIDAVAEARSACWRAMPHGKSWAAYQCYGDANWVYRTRTGDAQAPASATAKRDEFAEIASPPALTLALETLATRARYMGGAKPALAAALQQLVQRFEARWGGIGAVAEAFAVAWQAMGDRPQAITWYGRAVAAADGSASFKAEEQMLNLSARQAWAEASDTSGPGGDLAAQRQRLVGAVAALQQLCTARPSSERLCLLGSACKRLYLLERHARRNTAARQALQRAHAAYRDADLLVQQSGSEAERCYPLQNAFALALCLDSDGRHFDAEDRAALASAQRAQAERPDFWSEAGALEFRLWLALAEGRLAAEAEALRRAFTALHGLHNAPGDWASVADQAELVLAPRLRGGSSGTAHAARTLRGLLQQFAQAPGAAA